MYLRKSHPSLQEVKIKPGLNTLLTTMFLCMTLMSCSGQQKKENSGSQENLDSMDLLGDSLNHPKINVKVNKQYDKNGNVIRYDSTYSYVYKSDPKGTSLSNDSIYSHFKDYFRLNSPDLMSRESDRIFLNDSLFQYDFFNDDYFEKRFDLNQEIFRDLFKQMDSLKTNFLIEKYQMGNTEKEGKHKKK